MTPRRASRTASPILALLLIGVGGCGPTPEPSLDPPATIAPGTATPSPTVAPSLAGGVYLALGDSITFGIGVPQPQRNGFVARVADALDPPVETRIFAVPGETAAGFLERRLDDVVTAIEELGPRVELVTVSLGANELLRARRAPACDADPSGAACRAVVDAAIAEATEALDAVLAAVQATMAAEGSDARVLVLAYYNPDTDPVAASKVAGADGAVACTPADPQPGLNDRIACVAADRGAELVDLYAAFLGREEELTRFARGDVHPNGDGYEVIAARILDALSQ